MAEERPLDLSEPKDVKKRNVEIKRNEMQLQNDILWLLSFRQGRRILWWLLEMCQTNHSGFDTNALKMAFASGRRDVGLQVMAQVTTRQNIDLYFQALKEQNSPDPEEEKENG